MDMTFETVDALWRPSFVFKYHGIKTRAPSVLDTLPWDDSALNPRNRVDSLPVPGASRWRIDGSATFKTHFFALPLDLLEAASLPPLRIDIYLPDQDAYPPALRQSLDATRGVPLVHPPAIAALGISRYLCLIMERHCARDPNSLKRYRQLPFGSRIVINRLVPNVDKVKIAIEPNYNLESTSTALSSLQSVWSGDIPLSHWPPVVDLFSLAVVRQLHDSVTLVRVLECTADLNLKDQLVIFKSGSDDFHHVLHELKFLLTTPPHPNLLGKPLAVVTKKSSFGGKQGVYGFLIPYLSCGTLRDLLPSRTLDQTLTDATRLGWCIDVTSALLHILEQGATFYSDLRPDNVLLDDAGHAVLCDFEQRGSWHEWCPPEVLYPQYIENLLNSRVHPRDAVWDQLFLDYARKRPVKAGETFVQSKNRPWFYLSRQSQEKAMVYTLGLFLYCVFEGLSSVSPSLPYRFPIDPEINFPIFRRTPVHIRDIIQNCTADAPQWLASQGARHGKVARFGSLLYPPFPLRQDQVPNVSLLVLDVAYDSWTDQLKLAREFFCTDEWDNQEFGASRPKLTQVLDALRSQQEAGTI